MAFDSARGQMVLFGGWAAPNVNLVFRDTWEYDGTTWAQRSPATIPAERCEHAMCFDSVRNVVVMFGGQDFNLVPIDETWEWDGNDWTLRQFSSRPSARQPKRSATRA